jgi:hypothetical protein
LLYYYFVARVGGSFLDSEFSGSAILLAIAFPIYAAASWLRQHRQARRGTGQTGQDGRPDQNGNDPPSA